MKDGQGPEEDGQGPEENEQDNWSRILLNPNCAAINFTQYVKEKCNFDDIGLLAFCDETGHVIRVDDRPPMESLAASMDHRGIYIPLQLEKDSSQKVTRLTPMLKDYEKTFPALQQKLKAQVAGSPDKQRKRSPLGERLSKKRDADKSKTTFRLEKDSPTMPTDTSAKKSLSRVKMGRGRKKAAE